MQFAAFFLNSLFLFKWLFQQFFCFIFYLFTIFLYNFYGMIIRDFSHDRVFFLVYIKMLDEWFFFLC